MRLYNTEEKITGDFFEKLLLQYQRELFQKVIPFWTNYGIDWKYGGINTCISDSGELLSRDKYMWSQLRAIWTFSALYNKIEKKKEWLDIALHIYEFVKEFGRDKEGNWVYSIAQDGTLIKGSSSIYTDGFAIEAFTELGKATHRKETIELAINTYRNVRKRLKRPGSHLSDPLPIPPGAKAHGIAMIFSKTFHDLGKYLNNKEILEVSLDYAMDIMTAFRKPGEKRIYEFLKSDNTFLDSPPGYTTVPGHAIESMWFMIDIFKDYNNQERIRQALECILWHLELGWDSEYGGIYTAIDADGSFWEHQWNHKLWWVHAEALHASLLGYYFSGEKIYLDWFLKIQDFSFTHYPVPYYGEWYQRLDRIGEHVNNIAAMPVKDPYHVARSMIYCIKLLEQLVQKKTIKI